MPVLILANPFSGSGPNRAHMDTLSRELQRFGVAVHIAWTPAEGRALLRDFGRHARAVVAAGGDGSICGVLGSMRDENLLPQVPFATFPMGNENLFAKHFGFKRDPARLAARIARGKTRPIDLGLANGRLFSLMAGCGLDGEVAHRLDRWRRSAKTATAKHMDAPQPALHRVTRMSYAPHILKAVARYAYPAITLEADGQTHTGAMAMVCNLAEYGGGLKFALHAKDDDGLLDWVVFKNSGTVSGLRYAFSAYLGRHLRLRDVLHGQAARITLAANGAPVQVDGDPAGHAPIAFESLPKAAEVIVAE